MSKKRVGWLAVMGLLLAAGLVWGLRGVWPGLNVVPPAPLLFSSSEQLPEGAMEPPPALARLLLSNSDGQGVDSGLDQCRREKGLMAMPLAQWLVSVPLPRLAQQPQWHFVRPALEPFCMSLYGAHSFTFWLVQEHEGEQGPKFTELWSDSGDLVAILPTHHEGVYDMDVGYCTAQTCSYRTLVRREGQFVETRCRREHFEDGKWVHTEQMDC